MTPKQKRVKKVRVWAIVKGQILFAVRFTKETAIATKEMSFREGIGRVIPCTITYEI